MKGSLFECAGYALVQCSPVVFHRWLSVHLNLLTDKVFPSPSSPYFWSMYRKFYWPLCGLYITYIPYLFLVDFHFSASGFLDVHFYQTLISMNRALVWSKQFFFCLFFSESSTLSVHLWFSVNSSEKMEQLLILFSSPPGIHSFACINTINHTNYSEHWLADAKEIENLSVLDCHCTETSCSTCRAETTSVWWSVKQVVSMMQYIYCYHW